MLATAPKIRTIDYSKSTVIGTGTMSPRARRTLAVYSILVKWGYDGISAPAGAIADAIYRSSCGAAASIRTLQRANKELSERGYISCPTFRPGHHSRGTLIKFHKDAFRFFSQENSERRNMCDTQPHATTCRPSELTNQQYTNNSQHINKLEEPRAGARASNKTPKTPKKKSSVLFSLNIVLGGMKMHRIDRKAARARVRCEMDAIIAGAELLSPSGVDWQYWEARWPEMTIQARESTCRREIIPLLIGDVAKREVRMNDAPRINARKGEDVDRDAISPDEIRRVRENLFCRSVDVVSVEDDVGSDTDGQNYLGSDEMSILSAARERADMRRSNNLGVASVSDLLNRR